MTEENKTNATDLTITKLYMLGEKPNKLNNSMLRADGAYKANQ